MGNTKTKPVQNNPKSEPNSIIHPSTSQLQVRNCVRNVRNIGNTNFSEIYPDNAYAGPSTSPIYTIGVNSNGTPSNYTNAAYVITENPKASQSNDGLPSYEEAMTGIRTSMSQCSVSQSTTIPIEAPAEEVVPISSKRGRKHRHRHHQRHNRRPRTDASANQPTEHSPCATYSAICESRGNAMGDEATRGRHGRRGRIFRNQRRHHRHNHHQNQQE